MTPNQYREKLTAELKASQPPTPGYKAFLDKSLSTDARQKSLQRNPGGASADDVARLCEAATDTEEHDGIRSSALQRLAHEGKSDASAIDTVLKTLADSKDSASVRQAAFSALKQLLFVSPTLREKRSDYVEILRKVAEDEQADSSLREDALELLARRKDGYAQNLLMETLQGKKKLPLPLARTIQLLGNDIHSDVYPMLRKILENPPDEDTAHEAVRVLSADPASAEFLGKIFLDKKRSEQVRRAGGIAVKTLDPKLFESLAKEVAVDTAAPEGLRATSVQSLERFANPAALGQDADFQKQLKESIKQPSEIMKNSVQRLQSKLGL